MKTYSWEDVRAMRKGSPERRTILDAQIAEDIKDLTHDEIVKSLAMTPEEIRAMMGVTPAEFLDEEIREVKDITRQMLILTLIEPELSPLRKRAEALGVKLEVVVVLGNQTFRLRGV